MTSPPQQLARELALITGAAQVLTSDQDMAGYVTDWTRRYAGRAACVVRPGSVAEIAEVVRHCAARGVPLVPQGGNTGLVGGSVPAPAAHHAGRPQRGSGDRDRLPVVLSTRRLAALGPVDRLTGLVTAEAGVTIARLRAHAAQAGLEYGVDLASRDSATVGGTVATNAGGIQTIRYGPTRAQLLGLTAVLPDGRVMDDLSRLAAGAAGYDLAQLLAGSEGTLAVITSARLRLWPAESAAAVLLAGTSGVAAAAELHAQIRAHAPGLRAVEYFEADGLELVLRQTGLPRPLATAHPAYLLAEIPGTPRDAERLAEAKLPADTAVAVDRRGRAALWAYRERLAEAISAVGIPHKVDVAVPLDALAAFRAELDDAVRAAAGDGCAMHVFGHIGVGNLHVNVVGPDPRDDAADLAVARLAVAHGGSPAAEHGIGRAKAGWLSWSRTAGQIAAMRAIKSAFDPAGLLNPGVLLI